MSKELVKKQIELILKQMMSKRKPDKVGFVPYSEPVGYNPCWPGFDFAKIYPEWEEGDAGYVVANLPGPCERDLVISVTGDCDISFNGEIPESYQSEFVAEPFKVHGINSYRVKFREGDNFLVVRQKAGSDYFKFEIYIGDESGPIMWPTEYIYKTRPVIPFGSMKNMEGMAFSRIYKKCEKLPSLTAEMVEWIGPEAPDDVNEIDFDFASMTKYDTACALTWAKGNVKITHEAPVRVYVDGKNVYEAENGLYEGNYRGELLCVEADKTMAGFGFKAVSGEFSIPEFKTDRRDLSWIWLEGVENAAENIQFKKPYVCTDGNKTFFRYLRKDTFYRPYLNTCFFGQWFYAIQVGHYGLLKMAQKLGKQDVIDYFIASRKLLCDYYDYIQYDNEKFGAASFLYSSTKLKDLDSIGTIGMNVWEYIQLTDSESGKKMLEVLRKSLDNVPRTEDGTFYRIKTFWADDFFMSIPFLARLGGDYITEAVHHMRGFSEKLYMPDKKIYSHIYFVEEGKANSIPWGRGNGWVIFALSELLMHMPEDHPHREEVLERFRDLTDGILSYQGEKGMWHQVIDDHETYEESSGTGMYIIAMSRGIKNGWIDKNIAPKLVKAWNRLAEICIDEDGNALNVCTGSGCHMGREYYKKLGSTVNDDHGIGVFLLAASEVIDFM